MTEASHPIKGTPPVLTRMETNLTLPDGLGRVLTTLAEYEAMWPAALYKILGIADGDEIRTLAVHLQVSPNAHVPRTKVRLQAPFVIEGAMPLAEFRALLVAWSSGRPARVDRWKVPPPEGVQSLWLQSDVAVAPDIFPLLEDLPRLGTTYRESRLNGSGQSFDPDVRTWLQDRMFDLDQTRAHPTIFSRDYLGVSWGMDSTYLLLQAPLAVGLEAAFNEDSTQLEVAVHFRPPLTPQDFEVRVGSGRYDASLPTHTPELAGQDEEHWDLARVAVPLEPGGVAKAWLSRRGMVADFGWELTVDLGRPKTPELKRERFIADWYRLGRKDIAREVDVRMPGMGKEDRPSDAFELAISNAWPARGSLSISPGTCCSQPGLTSLPSTRRQALPLPSA